MSQCVYRGEYVNNVVVRCPKEGVRYQQVFTCPKHHRCLPFYNGPWHPRQAEAEKKLYKLCFDCLDYEAKE